MVPPLITHDPVLQFSAPGIDDAVSLLLTAVDSCAVAQGPALPQRLPAVPDSEDNAIILTTLDGSHSDME